MTNLDARASIQYLIDAYEVECRETVMLIKPQDYEAFKVAIQALEAQPCIEDYPTCTECEHYDKDKHYCPRFCQVIRDTLAEAQPKTEIKNLKTEIEKPKSEMTADGDLIRLADTDRLKKYRFSFDENTTIPKSDLFVRVTDLVNMPLVKPKKGKWIEDAENFYKAVNEKGGGVNENTPYFVDDIACSECLSKFSVIDNETERWKYCPRCGAEMSGGEEGGEDTACD